MKLILSSVDERKAFTLIELMVVVVLIGILSAMIIPEMRGTYEAALLRSTSRKLVDVFSLASSRAVCLNQLHRVQIDPRTGRYLMERRVRETARGIEFAPVQDLPGSEGKLDPRISIRVQQPGEALSDESESPPAGAVEAGGPGETISFYPDGTADARELRLRDRQGFRLALRINPITARLRVVDLERE